MSCCLWDCLHLTCSFALCSTCDSNSSIYCTVSGCVWLEWSKLQGMCWLSIAIAMGRCAQPCNNRVFLLLNYLKCDLIFCTYQHTNIATVRICNILIDNGSHNHVHCFFILPVWQILTCPLPLCPRGAMAEAQNIPGQCCPLYRCLACEHHESCYACADNFTNCTFRYLEIVEGARVYGCCNNQW